MENHVPSCQPFDDLQEPAAKPEELELEHALHHIVYFVKIPSDKTVEGGDDAFNTFSSVNLWCCEVKVEDAERAIYDIAQVQVYSSIGDYFHKINLNFGMHFIVADALWNDMRDQKLKNLLIWLRFYSKFHIIAGNVE
ncbi:hypothetical protein Tco_1315707 [Tanacetum coccineum]